MKAVKVTDLRTHLQEFLSQVQRGEPLAVTSRGKIIVRIVPAEDTQQAAKARLRQLRARAKVGDVVTPIAERWDAEHSGS